MQPSGVNQKYNLKNKINDCRQKRKYFNCLTTCDKSDRSIGPFLNGPKLVFKNSNFILFNLKRATKQGKIIVCWCSIPCLVLKLYLEDGIQHVASLREKTRY